jgi:ParB family chromosome partitioning protein
MAEKKHEKRGLGRGLSALMGDVSVSEPAAPAALRAGSERAVPIEVISPNPNQPRKHFEKDALADLAASIAQKGVLQPLIVRPSGDVTGGYEIVAGERRWRAAQQAKLHEVPVIIRKFTDEEAMEIAIIENIQRDDLNPVEEAEGYRSLMETHSRTQEELARALGKSRSHIANMVRLLSLPEGIIMHLRMGNLTVGHARALITAKDPSALATEIISRGLSVRQTEALAKNPRPERRARPAPHQKDADTRALEGELSATLDLKVSVDHDGSGEKGKVTIRYGSFDELDDICRLLSGGIGSDAGQ